MSIMKITNFSKAASVFALIAATAACDEGLTDVNDNPNAPTDVDAQFIASNAIESSVSRALGANFNLTLTGLWSQQVAKIQYIDEDRYDLRDATVNAHWAGFYSGPLVDFQVIKALATEAGRPNQVAVAKIMQSWTFQQMTDVWGDIPYSQALLGDAEEAISTASYDSQQAIYAGMLNELEAAAGMIDVGAGTFGAGDLIYNGDAAAWRKFANSLRLRLAMRMSEVDPGAAEAEFAAALAAGVFESNADNAQLVYGGPPSENPIHENFHEGGRFDHVISATMVDTLKSLNDPRLAVYATVAPDDGEYRGMPNGLANDHGIVFSTLSRIGDYFLEPTAPAVLQSYSEVLFLQAEAAERGWIAGDAGTLYRAAITASLAQYGITGEPVATYLTQPAVVYTPGAAGLQQIAIQKWIALFMNGPEAYAEWRRTGYPQLTVVPQSVNGDLIPVRVFYPSSEQAYNNASLQAAITQNGGDDLNDPVWWDQ
jgi:hypothetical protein